MRFIPNYFVVFLILACENLQDPNPANSSKILYPDSVTDWQHWEYDQTIAFSDLDADSAVFYIYSITNPIYNPAYFSYSEFGGMDSNPPLQINFSDNEHASLACPVDSRWGTGHDFQILAVVGTDSVFSEKFQILSKPLPQENTAMILARGTTYYYRKNIDYSFSWWTETVLGDTLINGFNYSVVESSRSVNPSFMRADSIRLYSIYYDGTERIVFDLSEAREHESLIENMLVLGIDVPGVRYSNYYSSEDGTNGSSYNYAKLFGKISSNTSNPQWMESSWELVAVKIDGVVYGDTTRTNYDIYP